ncbi:MAG: hypothetical protein AB4290_28655, partial [Spirulina sp.]
GLTKILEARRSSEEHENQGKPYTMEKLGERTGLDPHTLYKVFGLYRNGVNWSPYPAKAGLVKRFWRQNWSMNFILSSIWCCGDR